MSSARSERLRHHVNCFRARANPALQSSAERSQSVQSVSLSCGSSRHRLAVSKMLKRVLKSAALGTTSVVALGAYSLSVDAPMADRGDGKYTHEREAKFPDWVHNVARVPLFLAATTVAKIYLQHLSSFTVEGNEILRKHLDARPKGAALITVSNHSATVDDPGVLAAYVLFVSLSLIGYPAWCV